MGKTGKKLLLQHRQLSWVLRDDLEGWGGAGAGREVQEGADTRIHTADSFHCGLETNTIL